MKKKTLSFTFPASQEKMTAEYDGRSARAVVIGVDTAIGFALAHSLKAAGFAVIGFGDASSAPCGGLLEYRKTDYMSYGTLPEDCNLLLFCHDAAVHPECHVAAMDALCRHLAANLHHDNQMAVCVFTPANACECTKQLVTEDAALDPHSLRDLAYAQAEMTLRAWSAVTQSAILPKSFRYGELYADMPDALPLAGHVNACLKKARLYEPIVLPGLGSQKRTLTHLHDFAEMVALAVKQDFIPAVTNIPGEVSTIIQYVIAMMTFLNAEVSKDVQHYDDDLPWGVGNRALFAPQFLSGKKRALRYQLKHSFRDWILERPACAPALAQFDIADA